MNPARPTAGEVAHWIASHLAAHPLHADTAEGVRQWWLRPRHGEVPLEVVQQALDELEARKVVSRDEIAGQVVYRRARGQPGA